MFTALPGMRIKQIIFIFLLSFLCKASISLTDTTYLKALYDRALDFDMSKKDSLQYYADYIEKNTLPSFKAGRVLSLRLRGIYHEMNEDYEAAINYYYQSLEEARKLRHDGYRVAALGDLAIVYNQLNQPYKTRDLYREALGIATNRKEILSIFTNATNLGSIYNKLNMPDSALYYLGQAEEIAEQYDGKLDLGSLYNNIGNAWFYKKDWDKALYFFRNNFETHIALDAKDDLWHDCINIADVYIEKKQFDSAKTYLERSLALATELQSRRKEADTYSLYSKYYAGKGEYKPAFLYMKQWHDLDTALLNNQTLQSVDELHEKFRLRQEDLKNKELTLEIRQEKLRKESFALLAAIVGFLALSSIVIMLLIRKNQQRLQKKNTLIQQQNEKLTMLNEEKNSLISMVSHDLSAPFTSIKLWAQILQSEANHLTDSQRKAIHRILTSADSGETLIKRILFVDKEELGDHRITLEHLDINAFLEDIVHIYREQAQQKDIRINYTPSLHSMIIISDRLIVKRIIENLLSNAIKFTETGRNIWVNLADTGNEIEIKVQDEGVGIKAGELNDIFAKHHQASSLPTGGEFSSGLGLFIVKRLAEELNGTVFCESEEGGGSVFIVRLPK